MIKAFNTFHIEKGYKFTSYATIIMQNEILMALRKHKKDASQYAVSLDVTVHENYKDNSELTLMDMLEDTADSVEDQAEDRTIIDFIVNKGKKLLNEKEYFVVMSYLENGEVRQREIANILDVSQSYVSRLFAKAIRKIRLAIEGNSIPKPKKTITEKESEIIMKAIAQENVIHVPNGTLYERIKYIMENCPPMSSKEISELLGCNVNSVRSYISQIKREAELSAENTEQPSAPKEEPVIVFKEQSSPSINQFPSPNYISLSLKGASAESIQFMLKSIASSLQGDESYNLVIDVTKKAEGE